MMTAKEARANTEAQITKIAKEFIINNVGQAVQEAIDSGHFYATVSFEGVPNPETIGPEVVKQLETYGYRAKHTYHNDHGYSNYISVYWEDED